MSRAADAFLRGGIFARGSPPEPKKGNAPWPTAPL